MPRSNVSTRMMRDPTPLASRVQREQAFLHSLKVEVLTFWCSFGRRFGERRQAGLQKLSIDGREPARLRNVWPNALIP